MICDPWVYQILASVDRLLMETIVSSRIQRYLLQHPYITTLTLNVFNPGRANLISDALLCLQSKKEFADLRYDIRLFSQNPEIIDTGESLFELIITILIRDKKRG